MWHWAAVIESLLLHLSQSTIERGGGPIIAGVPGGCAPLIGHGVGGGGREGVGVLMGLPPVSPGCLVTRLL